MLPTRAQLVRECEDAMSALDATLADLSHPLPWFDGDLNEATAKGLKPTCDEHGNWRYVPAVLIDGPRVPLTMDAARVYARTVRERMDAGTYEFVVTSRAEGGNGFETHDEAARVAVEGKHSNIAIGG